MNASKPNDDDVMGGLPEDLQSLVKARCLPRDILAAATYDLDGDGRYTERHLVLTATELEDYAGTPSGWDASRQPLADLDGAVIVEGLGMSLLRLLADGAVVA